MLDYGPVSLFNTFGYLHLPCFFGADEVDRLSAEFDVAIQAAAPDGDGTQTLSVPRGGRRTAWACGC